MSYTGKLYGRLGGVFKEPCLCGAEDCIRCYPSHFQNGVYLNPDHWCDVCQRFTGSVCYSCEWCGRQMCEACQAEHREECGDAETKGAV
jgi:hypothetical protein